MSLLVTTVTHGTTTVSKVLICNVHLRITEIKGTKFHCSPFQTIEVHCVSNFLQQTNQPQNSLNQPRQDFSYKPASNCVCKDNKLITYVLFLLKKNLEIVYHNMLRIYFFQQFFFWYEPTVALFFPIYFCNINNLQL